MCSRSVTKGQKDEIVKSIVNKTYLDFKSDEVHLCDVVVNVGNLNLAEVET